MPVYKWTEMDEQDRAKRVENRLLGLALCIAIATLAYLMVAGL